MPRVLFVALVLLALGGLAVGGGSHGATSPEDCNSEEDHHDYNKPLHIGAIFIIFATSVAGATLPLIVRRFATNIDNIYFSCGKLFGAGVILATGFIHMFPGADKNLTSPCLSTAFTKDYTSYSGLFAMLAIFFVQGMQVTASIYLQENSRKKRQGAAAAGGHSHGAPKKTADGNPTKESGFEIDGDDPMVTVSPVYPFDHDDKHAPKTVEGAKATTARHDHTTHVHGGEADSGHAHAIIFDARVEKRVGTYILELGIASHSIIIGVALGVAEDSEFRTLLIALIFHQFFEGLSLATVVLESDFRSKLTPLLMVLFYGLTTPTGVAIGVGVHDTYDGNAVGTLVSTGVLDAVSAGILIYDALVNIITPHISCPLFRDTTHARRFLQMLCLWVGAGIMSLIGRWA